MERSNFLVTSNTLLCQSRRFLSWSLNLRVISTMLDSQSDWISTLSYVLKNQCTVSTPFSTVFARTCVADKLPSTLQITMGTDAFAHGSSTNTNQHKNPSRFSKRLRPLVVALLGGSGHSCLSMSRTSHQL